MLIYAWFGPGLLAAAGLPLIAVPAVSTTGLLLLASLLGPTKEAWRHTGQYRVVPWGPPTDVSKKRPTKTTWASTEINLPGLTR